jgi:hypothetical protein
VCVCVCCVCVVCVCVCVWCVLCVCVVCVCGCGELRKHEEENNQQKYDENIIHDQIRARLIFYGL